MITRPLNLKTTILEASVHPLVAKAPRTAVFRILSSEGSAKLIKENGDDSKQFAMSLNARGKNKKLDAYSSLLASAIYRMRQGETRRVEVTSDITRKISSKENKILAQVYNLNIGAAKSSPEPCFLDLQLVEVLDHSDIPFIELKESLPTEQECKSIPVLFMHGWPDDEHIWKDHVAFLTGKGYRCWTYTLPWYGVRHVAQEAAKKYNYDPAGYTFEQVVDGIMISAYARMQEIEAEKVVIVGHDWGAFHAQSVKARHPQLIDRAVIIDVRGGLPGIAKATMSNVRSAIFLGLFYQWSILLSYYFARSSFQPIRNLGHGMATRTTKWFKKCIPKEFQQKIDDYRIAGNMGYHYAQLQKLNFCLPFGLVEKLEYDENAGADEPKDVLFVFGTKKPFMFHGPGWVHKLNSETLETTKNSCAVGVPCGHWIPLEQSQKLSELVLQYIEDRDTLVSETKHLHHAQDQAKKEV